MLATLHTAPSMARPFLRLLRICMIVGATSVTVAACGDQDTREVKSLKEQVQRAYGEKEFAKALGLSQKGLALARKTMGDKAPDTLYFVQAISEANLYMRNARGAILALRDELALRSAAGQNEQKLQPRRTLLIQLAEENGAPMSAADQAVLVAKGIEMGPGKDPQPVYRPMPEYPVQQYRQKVEGDLEITFSLDSAGSVTDAVALQAFKIWRFTPMLDGTGRPVPGSGFKYTVLFRLK